MQFGNTCYSNSVLQALYFCKPFRDKVLEYKAKNKRTKETLLTCLADLFHSIATQKKKVGSIAPKKFIARLRKEKGEIQLVILYLYHILILSIKFYRFYSCSAYEKFYLYCFCPFETDVCLFLNILLPFNFLWCTKKTKLYGMYCSNK